MSSPATIMRELLVDLGLGSDSSPWFVGIALMPEGTANTICVYDTAGVMDGRLMETGKQIVHAGVQIRFKSLSFPDCWDKANAVALALDALTEREVWIESAEIATVLNVSRTGDLLYLGTEEEENNPLHHITLNAVLTTQ